MISAGLQIGELAARLKIPVETIRYYEREHLLPQARRTAGNYRLYDSAQVERLAFIRNCRAFDMTLDEIRKLLQLRDAPEQECGGVNQLLDEHIGHVGERLAELHRLKDELQQLRERCAVAGSIDSCAIISGLAVEPAGPNPAQQHLPVHRKGKR